MNSNNNEKVSQCLAIIDRADRIAVLTGAGISVPSGIPDFRSPGGIYSTASSANVFDIDHFHRCPEDYYAFAEQLEKVV